MAPKRYLTNGTKPGDWLNLSSRTGSTSYPPHRSKKAFTYRLRKFLAKSFYKKQNWLPSNQA